MTQPQKRPVTIVAGLPRSGTSMMMQMIDAGGLSALTDNERRADDDNPRGYYEFEKVKRTKQDPSWLRDAEGKVVKLVYRLLYDLPLDHEYRVVFLRRDLSEVLASQAKMLDRQGQGNGKGAVSDPEFRRLFEAELARFDRWVEQQPKFAILYVNHRDVLDDPRKQAERICRFLDADLDPEAMAASVDPTLYRNRARA